MCELTTRCACGPPYGSSSTGSCEPSWSSGQQHRGRRAVVRRARASCTFGSTSGRSANDAMGTRPGAPVVEPGSSSDVGADDRRQTGGHRVDAVGRSELVRSTRRSIGRRAARSRRRCGLPRNVTVGAATWATSRAPGRRAGVDIDTRRPAGIGGRRGRRRPPAGRRPARRGCPAPARPTARRCRSNTAPCRRWPRSASRTAHVRWSRDCTDSSRRSRSTHFTVAR